MAWHEDPEGIELKAAEKNISFKDKDVLEIGCGDGRFTAKYWGDPRSLVAIDPDQSAIRIAEAKMPSGLSDNVRFQVGEAEKLLLPSESFDVVIFSWSLCCVQDVEKSLGEAHRVLRPRGTLVNVMPEAVPSFEMAMLKVLGGRDAIRQGSLDAFRALLRAVQGGLFSPFEDQRIAFDTYFDSIEDLMNWLPSEQGPLTRNELGSISKDSLDAIRKFAVKLKQRQSLRVRDILIVSASSKGD